MEIFLSIVIGVISVLLIGVVLVQPSKTDGFQGEAPALGDNRYGKNKTEELLKNITIVLSVLFIILTLVLAIIS
ncbi:MAG: preprotein translocase subunit SecG [Firmicutes bacterium]|nr:preprotein translocase subunit SecG [Bacillota bacterium]